MKYLVLFCLVPAICKNAFSQGDYKKKPSLGFHFFLNDFPTAGELRTSGLANTLKSNNWYKLKRMTPGIAISYLQGLSRHIDFCGTLSGTFSDYPIRGRDSFHHNNYLLEAVAAANVKLVSDKYWVSPFLTLGAGAFQYKGKYYGAFFPVGAGLQVNFWDEAFILFQSQYRIPVTDNANYHFFHSVGVAGSISERKVELIKETPPLPAVPIQKDSDEDGVLDKDDKCPNEKGFASLQGCPDKDGDGLADPEDKCPDLAGVARFEGCPVPDSDKDGINDEEDSCVNIPGVARYFGCPVPDSDNDGVNNEEDKCPNEAGSIANSGCPDIERAVIEKINYAAQNIFFVPGSAQLLPKSYASLNEVSKILMADNNLNLEIEGHTDNTGTEEKNQMLSENRAGAVRSYLISKGIDSGRMVATGYGQSHPIADNNSAKGRAKNRRVELKLKNY